MKDKRFFTTLSQQQNARKKRSDRGLNPESVETGPLPAALILSERKKKESSFKNTEIHWRLLFV
jgi:hypothetical protein